MDEYEVPDVETSRQFGRVAMTSLMASASDSPIGAVLEANFNRTLALPELTRLQGRVIELFCRCPRGLCLARYRKRSSDRHRGHFDSERSDADLWNDETTNPVAGGWLVIEVDTSEPVDVTSLVEAVGDA